MNIVRNAAVFGLALLFATPALASDLVGTWEGKYKCTEVDAATGQTSSFSQDSVLEIAHVSTVNNVVLLNVSIDGTLYSSRAIDRGGAGSGKGVGDFVRCGSNDDAWLGGAEIEHFTFKVNDAKGTGSIKKKGQYNLTDGVPSGGGVGVCTGSWKRVSIAPPAVPACGG